METILISGGTGLIGRHLSKKLLENGYHIAILSRRVRHDTGSSFHHWDPDKKEIDEEAIIRADYIIHLAGAGIGDIRWTKKRKQEIIKSRVQTGELILDKIQETRKKLKAFISISGTGYYGTVTSDRIFVETDPSSDDFLGKTCKLWEDAADRFADLGIRIVKIRTGIVLAKEGGALVRIAAPVRAGIGSVIGNGNQYIPWIHIDDLCNIFLKAIEDDRLTGSYNATAPDFITNRILVKTLTRILGKPWWFPDIPACAMRILFGEMAEILLKGSRVSSEKIRAAGFQFQFPDLEGALKDLLKTK